MFSMFLVLFKNKIKLGTKVILLAFLILFASEYRKLFLETVNTQTLNIFCVISV